MKLRIGLTFDLKSDYLRQGYAPEAVAELDTEDTIAGIEKALRALGHRVERIGHARALAARLARGARWDLVFNIAEGLHGRGRESAVPCLLEMYHVPYTFSDPLTCALTLDKAMAKRILRAEGLATPDFQLIRTPPEAERTRLKFPLFAKPVAEGSGKGVDGNSRVRNRAGLRAVCRRLLRRFHQPVLLESYLPGREFTVGILGTGRRARVLSMMEIRLRRDAGAADYSMDVKDNYERLVDYLPVPAGRLRRRVGALALASHRALECRDVSRVDVRLDAQGAPNFIEINPLPGLNPVRSDLPILARLEGCSYGKLIAGIVASARERIPHASRTDHRPRRPRKG